MSLGPRVILAGMDQQIENYNFAVEQSGPAMTQDYYKDQPPFKGAPAYIPLVPISEDGTPLVDASEVRFKYIELTIGDKTYLAVVTPWTVANGPGPKYEAVPWLTR